MDTINTVNFEDLFDFSPEPAPGHHVIGGGPTAATPGGAEDEAPREKLRTIINTTSSRQDRTVNPQQETSRDAFADLEAVLTDEQRRDTTAAAAAHHHHQQLSASVPIHLSHHGEGNSFYRDLIRASKDSLSSSGTEFTVGSVDQLLNSLPGDRRGTDNSAASLAAATATAQPGAESSSAPVVVVKSKRGRKPGQKSLRTDMKTKLERSRQSARECRARKKLRYQYLDDLILERERANEKLREELMKYQKWCHELDKGRIPDGLQDMLREFKNDEQQTNM